MGLRCCRCHVRLSRICVPNLSRDYFSSRVQLKAKCLQQLFCLTRQNRHSTKMYVMQHNTLLDIFRIRIVWFQPKQDSNWIRISFFKNRIGSDSKNPLSDHLWALDHRDEHWTGLGSDWIRSLMNFVDFGLDWTAKCSINLGSEPDLDWVDGNEWRNFFP